MKIRRDHKQTEEIKKQQASEGWMNYTFDIAGQILSLSEHSINYGGVELSIDDIEGLKVIRTDTYTYGVWVNGTRIVELRANNGRLRIDCSKIFPSRDKLDQLFSSALDPIWSVIGSRLIGKLLDKLANDENVAIGGVNINRNGVYVDGGWSFLWWKAKPRLIPWTDLKIFSTEGVLYLKSISNLQYRSELKFNEVENSTILDAAIRYILRDNNWKRLQTNL